MKTLLDLFRFGPQIAFGGDTGGGGGGGSSSSDDSGSSSSSSTRTEQEVQDDINQALKDSGGAWTPELNDLVAERDDVRAGGTTTTTTTTTTSSGSSKPTTTTTSSSDDDDREVVGGMIKGNTIGQVSKSGQYAGDGFEWVETETTGGSKFLTRTYTGAGKDNGLGQDVLFGNTAEKDLKETIAQISLNEGSAFAASKASATDIPANDFGIPTGFFPESGSYAEQVGQADYTPTMQYGDSEPEVTKTFSEVFAEERAKQGDGGTFTFEGKEYTTDLAPEVDTTPDTSIRPEARPEEETGPAFDYTGVSMGELGRGAPEGTQAPGTFSYEVGTDPEMEMLLSLKNKDPDLLKPGEYLAASQYEKDKEDRAEAAGGVQVAEADTGIKTDADKGFFQNLYENIVGSGEADTPGEMAGLAFEAGTTDLLPALGYQGAEQLTGAGIETLQNLGLAGETYLNPEYKLQAAGLGDMSGLDRLAQEQYINTTGDYTANQITAPIRSIATRDESALEKFFQAGADRNIAELGEKVENFPPALQEALQSQVFTSTPKFGYGEGQIDPAFASALGEELDATVTDFNPAALGYQTALNAPSALGTVGVSMVNPYAGFTVGGTMAGGEGQLTANQKIDDAFNAGTLQQTDEFKESLKNINQAPQTASLTDEAKNALAVTDLKNKVSQNLIPLNVLSGTVSAVTPGLITKGPAGVVTVPSLEGFEEGFLETGLTEAALQSQAGVDDPETLDQKLSEAAVGFVTAGPAGISSLISPSTTNQNQTGTGPAGGPSSALDNEPNRPDGPNNLPGPVSPTGIDVTLSPTFGQVAQSNVDTAYNAAVGTDSPVALLQGPKLATSMDVMAAAEIIDNQIAETGTVAPEVLTNLQTATGLSMAELNNIVDSSPAITGNPRTPDLTDEVTGIGGGSNISVEPLPSGETLLRNNRTGRMTVVNEGANLAEAIQVFDEVSTPFEAPAAETTPDVSGIAATVPDINMGVISQLNQIANTDTAPVLPGQFNVPARANNVQLASSPAPEDGSVIIDTSVPALAGEPETGVGGLVGEILQGEVGAAQEVVQEDPTIIDVEGTVIEDPVKLGPPVKDGSETVVVPSDPEVTTTPTTEIGPPDFEEDPPAPALVGEPDDDGGVTVDLPIDAPNFVPPVTSEDEDGNTETKCPDGYQMVDGPDGPICQKSVENIRMRAGRSLQPYTRLRIPEGYRGPGQRRKTVTTTTQAEPITT